MSKYNMQMFVREIIDNLLKTEGLAMEGVPVSQVDALYSQKSGLDFAEASIEVEDKLKHNHVSMSARRHLDKIGIADKSFSMTRGYDEDGTPVFNFKIVDKGSRSPESVERQRKGTRGDVKIAMCRWVDSYAPPLEILTPENLELVRDIIADIKEKIMSME